MKLKQIRLRPLYYQLKHRYFTVNNAVIAVAAVVALSWAWGSIAMMQRNYELQRKLDGKERELLLTELEVDTLTYQQAYYQTEEYQELAARRYLGLAQPGEKVLNLPPNSQDVLEQDAEQRATPAAQVVRPTNFEQWLEFLSGQNIRDLSDTE